MQVWNNLIQNYKAMVFTKGFLYSSFEGDWGDGNKKVRCYEVQRGPLHSLKKWHEVRMKTGCEYKVIWHL